MNNREQQVREAIACWPHTHEPKYVEGYQGNRNPHCHRCEIESILSADPRPEPAPPVRPVKVVKCSNCGKENTISCWRCGHNLTPPAPPMAANRTIPLSQEPPFAYTCPASCGCLWRDNGDGTMSLFGYSSKSCEICETLPLDKLVPLYQVPTRRE